MNETTRYAKVAEMRNEWNMPGSNNDPQWCGLCLQQVKDGESFEHTCDERPELTDADRLTLKEFKTGKGWLLQVEIDGVTMMVSPYKIDRRSGKVLASRWEKGHYGEKHEFKVAKGAPVRAFSRHGVELYRGLTDAEINALEIAHRVQAVGRPVRVSVMASYTSVYAYVYVGREDAWSNSYSCGWSSLRPQCGRSTTKLMSIHENRSVRVGKQRKYSRKISERQFRYEVGYMIESAERRAQEGSM